MRSSKYEYPDYFRWCTFLMAQSYILVHKKQAFRNNSSSNWTWSVPGIDIALSVRTGKAKRACMRDIHLLFLLSLHSPFSTLAFIIAALPLLILSATRSSTRQDAFHEIAGRTFCRCTMDGSSEQESKLSARCNSESGSKLCCFQRKEVFWRFAGSYETIAIAIRCSYDRMQKSFR